MAFLLAPDESPLAELGPGVLVELVSDRSVNGLGIPVPSAREMTVLRSEDSPRRSLTRFRLNAEGVVITESLSGGEKRSRLRSFSLRFKLVGGAGVWSVPNHRDARFWLLGWAKDGVPGEVGPDTCRRAVFVSMGVPKGVGWPFSVVLLSATLPVSISVSLASIAPNGSVSLPAMALGIAGPTLSF